MERSRVKRVAAAASTIGLGVVVALGLVEALVRALEIDANGATVREDPRTVHLSELSGRVVWEANDRHAPGAPTRRHAECASAKGPRVHLYGDSILYGAGLTAPDSPGAQLESALRARQPDAGWCVESFAQPSQTLWVARAFADAFVPVERPAVVLIEVAYGGELVPVRHGDAVSFPSHPRLDDHGVPTFAFGLSGAVHRALFDASQLWVLATFAVNPGCEGCGRTMAAALDSDARAIVDATRAVGGEPILLVTAPLDAPFADTLASPPAWTAPIDGWANANGVRVLRVAELLRDQDVDAVRLDRCCHFSADGWRVLSDRIAAAVLTAPTETLTPSAPQP